MAVILFFGDSITSGLWDEEGGWVARVSKHLIKKTLASNFEEYYQAYNLGMSGDSTGGLVSRFEKELRVRVEREEGEEIVIVFAIGINDTYTFHKEGRENVSLENFKKNLTTLVALAQKFTSQIVFVGLTPVDEALVDPVPWRPEIAYTQDLVQTYNDALKVFCDEKQLLFIDMLKEWMTKDYKKLLIDGLHPNTEGHENMASLIIKELEEQHIF